MTRALALLLTIATGFSGLVYEVAWQKYLATLLGSHSEATAAVLGLFLGGLALGYALFGALSRRLMDRAHAGGTAPRLLLVYGGVEAAIGVYALLFPALFRGAQTLSFALPALPDGAGFALDLGLAALLIVPPTVLMGGTIPLLTQALARSLADATRFHAFVYAFNTAGAFAGALQPSSLSAARSPQASDASAQRGEGGPSLHSAALSPQAGEASAQRGEAERSSANWPAVALLVGFAMMTVQTVLIRLGGLAFGSSQPRIPKGLLVVTLWALVALLAAIYLRLDEAPYWAHALRSLFRANPAAFHPYYFSGFVAVLAVIGLPVLLSGATLPLIFDHLRRELADLGDVAGALYSWNTVGSLLGAVLGGYALLFWWNLDDVFRLAMAAAAVAAALATLRALSARRFVGAGGLLAAALAGIALLPGWAPERLSIGAFREHTALPYTFEGPEAFFARHPQAKLLSYDDDPTASVAVKQLRRGDDRVHRAVYINGKSDSAIYKDYVTTGLLALLPALLADRAERAFVVGYGTGVTAGELAALRSILVVDVAEISSGVIAAAPYFDYGNQNASKSPKIRIHRGDAFRMLYSREFLESARDRLAPGGVYAQWFHVYETDEETVAMVLRTYASVFDDVSVWYGGGDDLLLLGFTDSEAALDLERIASRSTQPDFAAGLKRCGVSGLAPLLSHELLPLGVLHATPLPGDLHTLLHPRLNYAAARAFFTGARGRLPVTAGLDPARLGARNSLVRRYAAGFGGRLPESARAAFVRETCIHRPRECVVLLAQWQRDAPGSAARARVLREIQRQPQIAALTPLGLITQLAPLYGEAPAPPDGSDAWQTAKRATDLFSQHYHHAAPFSRRALAELWRRCEADPENRERCREARANAESVLGDLDVDLVQDGR
jgi:predicted membrane-bound spermidine synthase